MCLDTISKRKPAKSGVFYKLFRDVTDFSADGIAYGFPLRRGEWSTAIERPIRVYKDDGTFVSYQSGFHGYARRDEKAARKAWDVSADNWLHQFLPCQYRDAHTMGTQNGLQVIVAREMRILLPGEKVPKPRKRLSSRKRVEA